MSEFLRDTVVLESNIRKTDGRLIVSGIFQKADTKNANGRVYKRRLWENLLRYPEISQSLKDRTMLGELGHPDIVETTLTNVSHVVTKLDLMPNGDVLGEAEILDTPSGRILKTLYEAGVKIGISSRGYIPEGSNLIPEGDGLTVPDDFQLIGFDFVLTPSTPGAHPAMKESQQIALRSILVESKTKLDPKLYSMLESLGSEKQQAVLEKAPVRQKAVEAKSKLVIGVGDIDLAKMEEIASDLTKRVGEAQILVKSEYGSIEILTSVNESEMTLLSAKINRYLNRVYPNTCQYIKAVSENKVLNLAGSVFSQANGAKSSEKVGDKVDEQEEITKDEYTAKLESVIAELKERYLVAEEVIEEMKSQNLAAVDVITDLKSRYLTAEAVIKQFKGYTTEMDETMKEVVGLYKTAEAVISDLAERYTLSEEVIAELRNRYLTAEDVIKESARRNKVAEGVITDLRDRYLNAETVIEELAQRYTLSEKVIAELRDAIKGTGTVEGKEKDLEVEQVATEQVTEGYIAEKAETFGISFKEAKRIYEKAGTKGAFEFVLAEKQSAALNRYNEFPFGGSARKVNESTETSLVSREDDKLTDIVARTMR